MRRWTQSVKQELREVIELEEIEKLRKEVNAANPEQPPFVDPLNDEQKNTVEARADARFDAELAERYD